MQIISELNVIPLETVEAPRLKVLLDLDAENHHLC